MAEPTLIEPENGWVLIKRGLYWRPDAQGYTGILAQAGLYSDEESLARVDVGVTRMRFTEAAEVAKATFSDIARDYWREQALAARAALERHSLPGGAAGYRLVPEEPTEAMYEGGKDAATSFANFIRFGDFFHSYKAMLAASPPPPSGFFDSLTPEQKAAALAYRGDDTVAPPSVWMNCGLG